MYVWPTNSCIHTNDITLPHETCYLLSATAITSCTFSCFLLPLLSFFWAGKSIFVATQQNRICLETKRMYFLAKSVPSKSHWVVTKMLMLNQRKSAGGKNKMVTGKRDNWQSQHWLVTFLWQNPPKASTLQHWEEKVGMKAGCRNQTTFVMGKQYMEAHFET